MLHILSMCGIPKKIIANMKGMYDNTQTFVDTVDGPTDAFSTTASILQGGTLALYLFVIAVDYNLRQSVENISSKGKLLTPRRSTRHPSKFITDLDYADNITLTLDNFKCCISLTFTGKYSQPCRLIFKCIVNEGVFPDDLKKKNVVPIHKKAQKKSH